MIDYAAAREAMVDRQVRPSDVTRYPIIAAMLAVPREDFVPDALRPVAYLGEHVPLAPGRVLLDPRVFAKLLDALNVGPSDLVLDLGCGLGYSTAVLARMAEAVVALEADAAMAAEAEALLGAHSVDNAVVQTGPLAAGVPEHGPFDAILVEGAIETLPRGHRRPAEAGGADRGDLRRRHPRPCQAGPAQRSGHRLAAYLRCNGAGASRFRRDESV